jgi:ATP-dependent DNA helicase RecG
MRSLQQALQVEADRGFINLKGRQSCFSVFVAEQLSAPPSPQPSEPLQRLLDLQEPFQRYDELSLARRQSLVRQGRERLHALRQALRPVQPVSPPRLRLVSAPANAATPPGCAATGTTSAASPTITADTPLVEVRGVGPKTAARLAQLGLLLVRDLVHYYPRDYLDYANLVRISGLEPGRTATIVATVRRSHAFASPRNPNLSILELHLVDCTGRIRVSRFFAGQRFSSPGWLKSQQRQFPPGATVAVSGLVKETPYGPAFQDPLMEVLESPQAPVRSEAIGRLLPVYGLTEGLGADRLRQVIEAVLPVVQRWADPWPEALR